ncbi:MAG TPA: FAD-dependent oxidoreductase [Solirubrobacteraceae bacterium]|nr:FAD-dependent oxidoreductase [Solirubrobacteraceae bacterium]
MALLRGTRRATNGSAPPAHAPHRSLWLREALDGEAPAPPLTGDARADVAIAGGGFVGLWTAIRIKEHDPACDVVVLERDVCGGGASGRNGGMALSWWPKLSSLAGICGEQEAVRLCRRSEAAIGELEAFCAGHGIDAQFRRDGMLWTATSPAQEGAWEAVVRATERIGAGVFERVGRDEVVARTGSAVHRSGVREPSGACLQPARLARGLRRVALDAGVRIHEQTRVAGFTRDRPVQIRTARGVVRADRLVIAMNAWAAAVPELRRSLIVVSSDIVATPPIPDRLAEIGWTGYDAITDSQLMVDYYRRTVDGRVAFGKGTADLAFGGRIGAGYDRSAERAQMATADFRRCYPALADVPVEQHWGGPIDRTPNSIPVLGRLGGREHIVYGVGWSGNGVAPSVIGGRVLAGLALGLDDEWTRLPLVDRRHDRFPPEPVRFVGGRLVRHAVIRKERAEARGRPPKPLAVRLARLAPAGLEDKE